MSDPAAFPSPAIDDPRAAASFLRRVAALAGALLAVLALVNAAADPYGVWRNYGMPVVRSRTLVWSRVAAAERLRAGCQVALLGSSRVVHGYGMDPPPIGGLVTCNGGIGGTSMAEMASAARIALEEPELRLMALHLDFHMFKGGRDYGGDWRQSRLNPERDALSYHLWTLWSADAVLGSFRAIGRPLGSLLLSRRAQAELLRKNHLAGNKQEFYRFLKNKRLFAEWDDPEPAYGLLDEVLDAAEAQGVKVVLIIPSMHAMLLEVLDIVHVYEQNLSWRRDITTRMAARGLDVWDFATYHDLATVPVPLRRGDPPSKWWVDVSHQSTKLGLRTLDRLRYAFRDEPSPYDPRFGVKLTPATIDAHLHQLRTDHARWREEHAKDVTWILDYAARMNDVPLLEGDGFDGEDFGDEDAPVGAAPGE